MGAGVLVVELPAAPHPVGTPIDARPFAADPLPRESVPSTYFRGPGGFEDDVLIESRERPALTGRWGVKSMSLAYPCRQPSLEHSGGAREGRSAGTLRAALG